MIYGIFSIFDKVNGTYGEPFLAIREEVAIRRFNFLMSKAEMVAKDCQLFALGDINLESGQIVPSLKFICNYEVANEA